MMTIDWEGEKEKVLARAERKIGFHAPPQLKKYIDEKVGPIYEREGLADYELTVRDYLKAAKLGTIARYLTPSAKPQNSPKKPPNPPEKRYLRPFKKRLYLVDFIISRQLTIRKQRNKIRKTINWEDTCRAWNEAHPNDPMTPKVLKATFYRAITDKALQREYLEQKGVGEHLKGMGIEIEGGVEIEGGFAGLLAWNRLVNLIISLVGTGGLAVDWAIVLDMNDIPLDKHFPTPEVERMIRNNPYYARRVMNEFLATWIMQTMVMDHFKAAREAYEPVYFGEGGTK